MGTYARDNLQPLMRWSEYELQGSLWISLERSIRLWEELIGLDFVIIC